MYCQPMILARLQQHELMRLFRPSMPLSGVGWIVILKHYQQKISADTRSMINFQRSTYRDVTRKNSGADWGMFPLIFWRIFRFLYQEGIHLGVWTRKVPQNTPTSTYVFSYLHLVDDDGCLPEGRFIDFIKVGLFYTKIQITFVKATKYKIL